MRTPAFCMHHRSFPVQDAFNGGAENRSHRGLEAHSNLLASFAYNGPPVMLRLLADSKREHGREGAWRNELELDVAHNCFFLHMTLHFCGQPFIPDT